MSSNSKYIGLREVHGHRNECGMGTAVEGWIILKEDEEGVGCWLENAAPVVLESDCRDRGSVWAFGGQSHAATGCYCTKGCVNPAAAPRGWTNLQAPSSSFTVASLHKRLPPLCHLSFPLL